MHVVMTRMTIGSLFVITAYRCGREKMVGIGAAYMTSMRRFGETTCNASEKHDANGFSVGTTDLCCIGHDAASRRPAIGHGHRPSYSYSLCTISRENRGNIFCRSKNIFDWAQQISILSVHSGYYGLASPFSLTVWPWPATETNQHV